MTQRTRALLDRALKLPPDERAQLATELWDSLEAEDDSELSPQWAAEIDRRLERLASGKAKGRPADEVLAEIRRELKDRRTARGKKTPR